MTNPRTTMMAMAASPARSRRCVRIVLALSATLGLAALAWTAFVKPAARVVYNVTDSVPVGWYRIEAAEAPQLSRPTMLHLLHVGSIVLTRLPAEPAALAAQRGYLPTHIPLLKRVGAMAPQHVCVIDGQVRIDGVPSAAVLRADRWGRALPVWHDCRPLVGGELFLLSDTNPASFDSRYFGPVPASSVLGLAQPIGGMKLP